MKTEASVVATSVSQALAKGACPICAILKDYQWVLATKSQTTSHLRVCNFHCWALARSRGSGLSRSTPGETVTRIFLQMLKDPLFENASNEDCDLCRQVLEEEVVRLRELAKKFQSAMFSQWITSQGTLCLDHAIKLKEFVPLKHRKTIEELVERNRTELVQELEVFSQQLKHGIHEGGGLLGRVAEFLVGQRGL
jgi:hypothetical protein